MFDRSKTLFAVCINVVCFEFNLKEVKVYAMGWGTFPCRAFHIWGRAALWGQHCICVCFFYNALLTQQISFI